MRLKTDLTLDDFVKMSEMEKLFYGEDHVAPPEEAFRWHEKFPNEGFVMEDDSGKIIGFSDIFLIKPYIFDALKKGTYNDKNLNAEDIEDIESLKPGDRVNMFLCCLVVLPEYRKSGVLKKLLSSHIAYYDRYVIKGIVIENIITDNVTDSGENFSRKNGFTKVTDTVFDSVIYMKPYEEFADLFR